jgi:stage VI sporulation protein D
VPPVAVTEVQPNAAQAAPVEPAAEAKPLDIDVDVNVEENEVVLGDAEAVEEAELQPEVVIHSEEKKDVKVALGGKKVAELAQDAAYGIKSLLQKSSSIFHDKRKAAEAAAAQPAEVTRAETVEWKKLFLNTAADGQEFRKLKMAIVQKEETLETIAQRYQISARELQLLNRLQDVDIAAGQVIYIPR